MSSAQRTRSGVRSALSVSVREELRDSGEADVCLARWQYITAAQRTGWNTTAIESLVTEWLYQRPLKYLRLCRRRGLETFCTSPGNKGIQIGVFSDYPVLDKLKEPWRGREDVCHALCSTIPRSMPLSRLRKDFCVLVRSGACVLKKYCILATAQRWMRLALTTLACPVPYWTIGPIARDR